MSDQRSKVVQVGSVRLFFSILLSSSLGESDVLKRLFFLWVVAAFVSIKSMGGYQNINGQRGSQAKNKKIRSLVVLWAIVRRTKSIPPHYRKTRSQKSSTHETYPMHTLTNKISLGWYGNVRVFWKPKTDSKSLISSYSNFDP